MNHRPARVAALFLLGSLLIQLAWVLALPPFRGIDEFDHAYRAAAVAEGEWKPAYVQAEHGRGWLVQVPAALVRAATPVCEEYAYTGRDNCHPVRLLPHGQALVASAAANYNPVFYWLIGAPAQFFKGASSLIAMRLAGSLLCSLYIGLAAWIVASWASTRWPLLGLAVALSPMVVYSTALGAPNGIEMLGGAVLWASLVGLLRAGDLRQEQKLIWAAVAGGIPLAGVRALGPLWLAMIVISMIAIMGRARLVDVFRRHRRALTSASVILIAGTSAGSWWTLTNGTNAPINRNLHLPHPVLESLALTPLWIFQSIGAFPTRTEQAPVVVYAADAMVIAVFLYVGLAAAAPRALRAKVALAIVVSIAVSFAASAMTYASSGQAWQGRYALPYMIGIPLLAALCMECGKVPQRIFKMVSYPAFPLLALAQGISVIHVLQHELRHSPLAGTPEWLSPPWWSVMVLAAAGVSCWAFATLRRGPVELLAGETRDVIPDIRMLSDAGASHR